MRSFLYLCIILLLATSVSAQKQGRTRLDSLIARLPVEKDDTSKVILLSWIAFFSRPVDPAMSIAYANDALRLSRRLNWKKGRALAYNSFCTTYSYLSDFHKAIDYADSALAINKELGQRSAEADNYGNIASAYLALGDYDNALENYFYTLGIKEELHIKPDIGVAQMGIGQVYAQTGDSSKSDAYLLAALKTLREVNDKENIGITLYSIAGNYLDRKDYAHALSYNNEAVKLFSELGDNTGLMAARCNAARIALGLRHYKESLDYSYLSLKQAIGLASKEYESVSYAYIGNAYLSMAVDTTHETVAGDNVPKGRTAQLASAIEFLNKAVALQGQIKAEGLNTDIYRQLAYACQLSGNYKDAATYYQRYSQVLDSTTSADSKVRIAKLETRREADLRKKETELNKLLLDKKRNEQFLFVLSLVLLTGVILFLLRSYRLQRRANAIQKRSVEQKELLLKEIHHRVKNNLQVISALLELQLANVDDEAARHAMTESNTRVRSIGLIHQQLYQNEDLSVIEFSRFAQDLMRQVMSVFSGKSQPVELIADIREITLDIDTAVPLGLMLNELMTNSFKYAFRGEEPPYIRLTVRPHADGYELIYQDSGPGLPGGINLKSIKSLGLRIIHTLSRQLAGHVTYHHDQNRFVVFFKDNAGRKAND